MNSFLKELEETKINSTIKGIPFLKSKKVKKLKFEKLNILQENVQFPILSIDKKILINNIKIMNNFAKKNNAILAPHCKTFMSPQLIKHHFKETWGVTISNNQQLSSIINLNIKNIIYGNLITNESNLIQYLNIIKKYKNISNIYYCIDSLFGLNLLIKLIKQNNYKFKIRILIELGFKNGRCGIRNLKNFKEIVENLRKCPKNIIVNGLFFYEGAIKEKKIITISKKIKNIIKFTFVCHNELINNNIYKDKNIIITAGGSEYFDLVASYFKEYNFKKNPKLILRPGSFIAYGHGHYEDKINLLRKRNLTSKLSKKNNIFFQPSLLLWSHVISIKDKGIAIINFGKRDVSFDLGNPIPLKIYRNRKMLKEFKNISANLKIFKLNDQHAFLRFNKNIKLHIGDLISFGVSHPCITFDKWRYFYIIDKKFYIIDIHKTFF